MSAFIHVDELYKTAYKTQRRGMHRILYVCWLFIGLSALAAIAWTESWGNLLLKLLIAKGYSEWLMYYIVLPTILAVRAIFLVETLGYVFHRFFQHVGFLTRCANFFRKNQRFHWIHHMIIYPVGHDYRRPMKYVDSDDQVIWSWVVPAILIATLFILNHGCNLASFMFIVFFGIYANYVVDKAHSHFHELSHHWTKNAYFQWLEKIHLLHHYDQRCNFTITFPLMDILFGSYLSPRTHLKELSIAQENKKFTVSDLINWRYLLVEATPAEYAAFISAAKQHSLSRQKIRLLIEFFKELCRLHPEDMTAQDLHCKSINLLVACSAN